MNKTDYVYNIKSTLKGRFQNNALGVFVIVGVIVFLLFCFEIIKFVKKIYTHNIPHNDSKYLISKIINRQENIPRIQTEFNINNNSENTKQVGSRQVSANSSLQLQKKGQMAAHKRQQIIEELGKSVKNISPPFNELQQQRLVKFLHRSIELIRQKLPLIAISLINVVMIASFEYLLVTLSIGVLLYIIIEILKKSEYENVAWILDLITHGLVIGWYVNMFTVGMPV